MLLRYLFGDDIFISYSRKDGKTYATNLLNQLKSMDYSCFIDFEKVYAGDNLSRKIQRSVWRSRVLILIATEGARNSPFVRNEIEGFLKTKRPLIPIDVRDALANRQWPVFAGKELVWIDESNSETPSPDIYSEINRVFGFRRRNTLIRVGATVLALVLLGISLIAVWQASAAKRQQALAEDRQKIAQAGELASWARAQLNGDPELGLLLAIEAVEKKQTPQTEIALKQLLAAMNLRKVLHLKDDPVVEVVISRDGKWLAASDVRNGARLWSTASGESVSIETGIEKSDDLTKMNTFPVAAFGPDDTLLFTNGRVVTKFKLDTSGLGASPVGEVVALPGQDKQTSKFSLSPDGRLIATTGDNGTLRLWEADTGRSLSVLKGHRGRIFQLNFSPDGKYLVTTGNDETLRVWDVVRCELTDVLDVANIPAGLEAAVSPDATFVFFNGRIWGRRDVGGLEEMRVDLDDAIRGAFSPDGMLLVTAGLGRTVRMWLAGTGMELSVLRGHPSSIRAAFFTADSNSIITVGTDKTLRLWDARVWTDGVTLRESFNADRPLRMSPNGELMVVLKEGISELVEVASGRKIIDLHGHEAVVANAIFSPDSKLLATIDEKLSGQVWEAASGRSLFKFEELKNPGITFSSNGRHVLTEGDGGILVRESATGKPVAMLEGDGPVVLSPDGRLAVLEDKKQQDRRRIVREVSTGRKLGELSEPDGSITKVKFSPDGEYIATVGSRRSVRVWDARTLQMVSLLDKLAENARDISFSPDGKLLATIRSHVQIWETRTARLVAVLSEDRPYNFFEAKFSPDNRYLVTSFSNRPEILLWDISSGIMLARLYFERRLLGDPAFSPDSKKLTLRSMDGAVEVFDCELCGSIAELTALARRRVTRALTDEERQQYITEP